MSENRLRLGLLFFILFAFYPCLHAQDNLYDFYINNLVEQEEPYKDIVTESDLFLSPESVLSDLFAEGTKYRFGFTKYSRRSFSNSIERIYFGNILVSSEATGIYRYDLNSGAYLSGFENNHIYSPVGSKHYFQIDPASLREGKRFAIGYSDHRGFNAKGIVTANITKNITGHFSVDIKGGKDQYVKGVFTRQAVYSAGLKYDIDSKNRVGIFSTGTFSENGLRSYSTKEAFELTGDNLYNPSWGYFNGKVRNSRVRSGFRPLIILDYERRSGATVVNLSLAGRFGESSVSGLNWRGAASPYPDYYRQMPSFASNQDAKDIITKHWLNQDPSTTQIDWEQLWSQNYFSTEPTVYMIEEKVSRPTELQAVVHGVTTLDSKTTISYGFRIKNAKLRNFKRMKDLLGGAAILDVDPYLSDEELPSENMLNNVRNPARLVNVGDRFGYNYIMNITASDLYASVNLSDKNYNLDVYAEFGQTSYQRVGNYEKQNYPEDLSYGKSKRLKIGTYEVSATLGFSLDPKNKFAVSASASNLAPIYGAVFISPNYSNFTLDCKAVSRYGAEASYSFTSNRVKVKATGYYSISNNEQQVYSYYDDIASTFSDMVVSGISKEYYGFELAAEYEISTRFTALLAGSMNVARYSSDIDIDIYEDKTLTPYILNSRSYMKNCNIGLSPDRVVSFQLKYNNRGWLALLSYNNVSGRYISPSPLRRMERAFSLADSNEAFNEFVNQEKLPDAYTVDLSLLKSFAVAGSYLTLSVTVSNLLDKQDIIYNGYEQMRLIRKGSGVNTSFSAMDSRYLYSYGRSFRCSLSLRF